MMAGVEQHCQQWIEEEDLPDDILDTDLTGGHTSIPTVKAGSCPVLSQKSPFTKDGWAEDMTTMRLLCIYHKKAIQEASSPELIPGVPLDKIVESAIGGMTTLQDSAESTETLTGLAFTTYLAMVTANKILAEKIFSHPSFDKVVSNAMKQYPTDNNSQLPAAHLLLMKETTVSETDIGPSFVYPAFQRGLPFFPDHGSHVTLTLLEPLTKANQAKITKAILDVEARCAELNEGTSTTKYEVRADFNVGFNPDIWCQWLELKGRKPLPPIERAVELLKPDNNFLTIHRKFRYQEKGHIFFSLKGNEDDYCQQMFQVLKRELGGIAKIKRIQAEKRNYGRVLGGRFFEGIGNAADVISLTREVVITGIPKPRDGPSCNGGSFAFTQFFNFDQDALQDMTDPVKEIMVGRSVSGEVLPTADERSHIKRARLISKKDGTNTEILRQSLPYAPDPQKDGPIEEGFFFIGFMKGVDELFDILKSLTGWPQKAFTHDLLLTHAQGLFGGVFYIPNANELGLKDRMLADIYPDIPFWSEYSSENPLLFYNHVEYLHKMSTNQYDDPPSKRILKLLGIVFSRWHSTWYHKFDVPRLPHLSTFLTEGEKHILTEPIQIRKGYSYRKMLGEIFTSSRWGNYENFGTFYINPRELIVGMTDRLSFGSGKEVLPYLLESERGLAYDMRLTEASNMGHITPSHEIMLEKGVTGILKELRQKLRQPGLTEDQQLFYRSAIYAYQGVRFYLLKYADLARETADNLSSDETNLMLRANMRSVAKRLNRLATKKAESFHDAVQMVFILHACLHVVGQPISVGRLDQMLIKYYEQDIENKSLTPELAQEIIEAFFIKFDEHVVLNRNNIPYDHMTYGTTAVTGRGGPFGTGDSLNQWIQQLTLGGYKANNKSVPEDGCNEVTYMCLRAARRLPLNAPCVSLRLNPDTPQRIIVEAAKAILSGGAHPILMNDEKAVAGLYQALTDSFDRSPIPYPMPDDLLSVSRDYACDGCFEFMFSGRTEFKFISVRILQSVILALGGGENYQGAGPLNLAGQIDNYRTPLPQDIKTFEQFQEIFLLHLKTNVQNIFGLILGSYGNSWKICPSPLLSGVVEGCVETGKDLTNGGARFHILSPMYVGLVNTINSLYCIKKMVYDRNSVTTLETLRMALMNNWGENMVEPFFADSVVVKKVHTDMWAQRYKDLREVALKVPKFGTPNSCDELNELAYWVTEKMNAIAHEVLYEGPIAEIYRSLQLKHSVEGQPFVIQLMTGTGTFEGYNGIGAACAATPDGRLDGQPIASDCSLQPYPQDRPVPAETLFDIIDTQKSFNNPKFYGNIPDGAEVDINIAENFSMESLIEYINAFAQGKTGSNISTVTCVDTLTMQRAEKAPQRFDLIRNRMGGWTNFFCAMPQAHQKQHERRPMYGPHTEKK